MNSTELDKRYVPEKMMSLRNGIIPVARYIAHPPNNHPDKCPIKDDMTALECVLVNGERRWWGVDGAQINSELRMVAWGGCINERNETTSKWEKCTTV